MLYKISLKHFSFDKENNLLTIDRRQLRELKIEWYALDYMEVESHVTGQKRTYKYDSEATQKTLASCWVYMQESPEEPVYELRILDK